TLQNLHTIGPALRRLQTDIPDLAPLRVVSSGVIALPGVRIESRQWTADTEVTDIQDCDIGLVPLNDAPWNPWKFYLKTVQYMAAGLPVVARRMGSNPEMIQDGVNGFVVETQDEWYERMKVLLEDAALRRRMGEAARETAVRHYSVEAQMDRVAKVFEEASAARVASIPRPAGGPNG
ncbi:MAG: glycosyltransferase, partial [Chloroflexi bacterium]|nr:glycosyltransferase [Chloroflexota bacterium]